MARKETARLGSRILCYRFGEGWNLTSLWQYSLGQIPKRTRACFHFYSFRNSRHGTFCWVAEFSKSSQLGIAGEHFSIEQQGTLVDPRLHVLTLRIIQTFLYLHVYMLRSLYRALKVHQYGNINNSLNFLIVWKMSPVVAPSFYSTWFISLCPFSCHRTCMCLFGYQARVHSCVFMIGS